MRNYAPLAMKIAIVLSFVFTFGFSAICMEAVTETSTKVPVIDIDNIDWNVFDEIVKTCG
jgi:hypothetical protein